MSGQYDDDGCATYHHCTQCGEELSFVAVRYNDALCPTCWVDEVARQHDKPRRDFGPLWGAVVMVAWTVILVAAVLWLVGAI